MRILPLIALLLATAVPAHAAPASAGDPYLARAHAVLKRQPIIDGHNDWAEQLRGQFGEGWWSADLNADSRRFKQPLQTDIPRLHQGQVGGQFWSVWVPATVTGPAAVKATLEQIDIVRGIVARHPKDFALASTAADIRRIQKTGRIASLIGVEGGSQIDDSLPALRMFYDLGVRYMTLTHVRHNAWADSANEAPRAEPLTAFGKAVVHEMNRIGMLVDLSHVSPATMKAALAVSQAPVIFSHSSARAITDHPRNVPDDVLALLKANGGIVMVNYAPGYVSRKRMEWEAARAGVRASFNAPPYSGLYIGQPDRAAAAFTEWEKANPMPAVTLAEVADHIDHLAKVAGHDHVGIGGDLDGIDTTPTGLEGVETYPALIAELLRRGWSDADAAKLAGGNILRVLEAAEKVAAGLKDEVPSPLQVTAVP
ncbi:dipeptidase [Polymorphobacter fuscus]|uniref:Membrane dipeptidase n=1 Tax=Sandarakinorhabdus fusca TaxID=1439888 RepID=A0A7C9GQC1_9SPHN|nr:dipeptidase [Polymorphobacter fuscus]KAB7644950.1 membrane dipeptidase [Polymorphobacter fuscus]MQT18237.1 membrane dipeptidase [Polymorphobacter fuscus]NJC09561.1 membrane dipeptidase [Polymorphobacter fuscus]